MTFRQVLPSEWYTLEEKFSNNPLQLEWYDSLVICRNNWFPTMTYTIYQYSSTSNHSYLYAVKRNKYVRPTVHFTKLQQEFDSQEFLEGLKLFLEIEDILSLKAFCIMALHEFTTVAFEYITEKRKDLKYALGHDTKVFYMTEEQEKKVLEWTPPKLPEGYELGEPDVEKDYNLMASTWMYAADGDDLQTREKLLHLPSSCIRYEGEPVSYEMLDHHGYLNHQFTHIEHRRKGLGSIVELDLAQKVIRKGLRVYKYVNHSKKSVIEAGKEAVYWTLLKDDQQNDVNHVYLPFFVQQDN